MFYQLIISSILTVGYLKAYVITGTTFRPDLLIPRGEFVRVCPDLYPFAKDFEGNKVDLGNA